MELKSEKPSHRTIASLCDFQTLIFRRTHVMLYYIVFIRSTINMLSSYNPYIGIITIKQVNRSGGVITAATMPISTSACRRYFFINVACNIPIFAKKNDIFDSNTKLTTYCRSGIAGGAVKKKASNILNHSTPFLQAHHVYSSLLS